MGEEGCTVSGKKGRVVADGPFTESREAIGGYLIVQAAGLDEALAISKSWPCLDYSGIVEVRPVTGECPAFRRAEASLAGATA